MNGTQQPPTQPLRQAQGQPPQPPIPPLIPPQNDSTHIAGAAHDRSTQTLYVSFHDQSLYAYQAVPEPAYQALLTAKSPGSFFNNRIKGNFKSAKLKSAPPKTQPQNQP